MSVKFAEAGIVEGWAVAFGSPSRLDQQGQYFHEGTDFALDFIEGPRPLMLHHGLGEADGAVIGRVLTVEKRPEGLWVRAQLDRASQWFEQVKGMLQRGVLGFSSGSLSHLVKLGPDGRGIARWPFVELSLTPSPADAQARVQSVKWAAANVAVTPPADPPNRLLTPRTKTYVSY